MAAPVRVTQQVLEVVRKSTTPPMRATQQVLEVVRKATTPPMRASQQVMEVIRKGDDPELRVTHQFVDVLRELPPGPRAARVSQIYTDTLRSQEPTSAWVSQLYTDTIRTNPPTAKPAPKSWMVFDKEGFFEVTMLAGAPQTAANIYDVLNGQNGVVIGQELLKFRDATDLGNNRFRCSYLLRGRLGTEQHMNSHLPNELAYFIDPDSLRRAYDEVDALNNLKYWKIVGIGQFLEVRPTIGFVNTGISLKPWAPVQIKATRDGSGNITITWTRRSRIGHKRILVYQPAIGELTEEYQVEILDNTGAVVRTFNPTTTTQVYSDTDQTTDFGGVQDPVLVRVGQVSNEVGVGYTNSELL